MTPPSFIMHSLFLSLPVFVFPSLSSLSYLRRGWAHLLPGACLRCHHSTRSAKENRSQNKVAKLLSAWLQFRQTLVIQTERQSAKHWRRVILQDSSALMCLLPGCLRRSKNSRCVLLLARSDFRSTSHLKQSALQLDGRRAESSCRTRSRSSCSLGTWVQLLHSQLHTDHTECRGEN